MKIKTGYNPNKKMPGKRRTSSSSSNSRTSNTQPRVVIRDSKTGDVIRTTQLGENIKEAQLRSRAATVAKNIPTQKVSEAQARQRAEQKLKQVQQQEETARLNELRKTAEQVRAAQIRDYLKKSKQAQENLNNIKKLEAQQRINSLLSKPVNQLTKEEKKVVATLEAPTKRGVLSTIRRATTPSTKDSGLRKGVKGVGSFLIDVGVGAAEALQTTTKAIAGDKAAQTSIKEAFTLNAISNMGAALGQQVQSSDPFQKTKGLLTIGTMIVPIKTPKIYNKVKITETKFKTTSNLGKDSAKTVITQKGFKGSEPVTIQTIIRQTKGGVQGMSSIIDRTGKVTKTKFNLKQLELNKGFFKDSKGKIIPPKELPVQNVKYNIREIKQKKLQDDRNLIIEGKGVSVGRREVQVKKIKGEADIAKGRQQEVTKTRDSVFDLQRDIKSGKITDKLSVERAIKAELQRRKNLKVSSKKVKKDLDKLKIAEFDEGVIVQRRGTITQEGFIMSPVLSKSFSKAMGKKARLLNKNKPLSKTEIKGLRDIPDTIKIPDLKVRIEFIRALRFRGLIPIRTFKSLMSQLQKKYKEVLKSKDKIQTPNIIQVKTPKKIQTRSTIFKSTHKSKTKPKTKIKTPIAKPIKPKTIKKPKIITKSKLLPKLKKTSTIKSQSLKNKLGEITYKEGNKVIRIKTGLPFNKSLKIARDTVDNTKKASMTVKAYGKTRKKDISTPSLKKFRLKKSKNNLVQKLVEKKKYRIDSTGEKKDLKGAKLKKFINKQIKKLNRGKN